MSCEDLCRDLAGGPGSQGGTREPLQVTEGTLPPLLWLWQLETCRCARAGPEPSGCYGSCCHHRAQERHTVEPPSRVSWRKGLGLLWALGRWSHREPCRRQPRRSIGRRCFGAGLAVGI